MLPEENGISILKKLRSNPETSGISVIMLTAKDTEFDVVTGLDSGADDYVTKPFGMMSLLSRIKAVLRRYEKSDAKILDAGNVKVDVARHTVLVGIIIYFVSVFILISNMYGYFEKQIFAELETESTFLEKYVEQADFDSLSKFYSVKNRITLIYSDGTVYFDNEADAAKMESHAFREEFLKAKENGIAEVSRFSSTMMNKTLYFAKLLSNVDVLRISCDQRSVGMLVFGFCQPLLITLVVAVIISALAASLTSKKNHRASGQNRF